MHFLMVVEMIVYSMETGMGGKFSLPKDNTFLHMNAVLHLWLRFMRSFIVLI